MTRLTAAKEYFIAFSNRIEAYGLPQVVGLISFNNKSKLEIPFTEVMDQFKVQHTQPALTVNHYIWLYCLL